MKGMIQKYEYTIDDDCVDEEKDVIREIKERKMARSNCCDLNNNPERTRDLTTTIEYYFW